jgi:hypothetical protein
LNRDISFQRIEVQPRQEAEVAGPDGPVGLAAREEVREVAEPVVAGDPEAVAVVVVAELAGPTVLIPGRFKPCVKIWNNFPYRSDSGLKTFSWRKEISWLGKRYQVLR